MIEYLHLITIQINKSTYATRHIHSNNKYLKASELQPILEENTMEDGSMPIIINSITVVNG